MKIVKNTTAYDTRVLRHVICKTHAHMKKLQGKPAPNWKNLRIKIGYTKRWSYHSGHAFYGGYGHGDHDMFLGLVKPDGNMTMTNHSLCDLVYHELMHTYGYRHAQYTDIPKREIVGLFPYETPLPFETKTHIRVVLTCGRAATKPKQKPPVWKTRYEKLLSREKAWRTKLKRAENALSKIEKQRKYYETRYAEEL